jgi:AcrR family transcriptional regulator
MRAPATLAAQRPVDAVAGATGPINTIIIDKRVVVTDDDIEAAKALLANPDIAVAQIAHRLGVSPATLYRYIPTARTANTPGV